MMSSLNYFISNYSYPDPMDYDPMNLSDPQQMCSYDGDITTFNFTLFNYSISHQVEIGWPESLKISFYILIILVGVVGNVGVILTVALNRSMRTTINLYLVNLAMSDILICTFCTWVHLINNLTHPVFVLGPFMCKFNAFAQMTALTSSVLTLSAISCDRFIAIMFPLHVRITKQRTGAVITFIWLVSVGVSVPFLFYRKYFEFQWSNFVEKSCIELWPPHQEYDPVLGCITTYPSKQLYYTFVTITLYFLPVAIMITSYSLIIWRLWAAKMPGERSAANLVVQDRAKKKVIKMVCVVLAAFVFCWTPLQVIVLYSEYGHFIPESGTLPSWISQSSFLANYLAYANSALNPIIYGGFNNNFRKALLTALRCSYSRQSLRRPHAQGIANPHNEDVNVYNDPFNLLSGVSMRWYTRKSWKEGSQKSRMTSTTGVNWSPCQSRTKNRSSSHVITMRTMSGGGNTTNGFKADPLQVKVSEDTV